MQAGCYAVSNSRAEQLQLKMSLVTKMIKLKNRVFLMKRIDKQSINVNSLKYNNIVLFNYLIIFMYNVQHIFKMIE